MIKLIFIIYNVIKHFWSYIINLISLNSGRIQGYKGNWEISLTSRRILSIPGELVTLLMHQTHYDDLIFLISKVDDIILLNTKRDLSI